jgi:hypothetical protein
MARKKLVKNRVLDKAVVRQASLLSIDTKLDFGNGMSLDNYELQITAAQTAMSTYNTTLSTLDDLYNKFQAEITKLKDWNERMLAGVATAYGKDSSEYEQAGGVRKSERKKPVRKAAK